MTTLSKNNIGNKYINNDEILKEFYSIIKFFISSDISCSNHKKIKLDVYKLLKQIGDIFIFIEPDKNLNIKEKLIDAFNSLSMIQRSLQSKNDEIDINKLQELITELEVILNECSGKDLLIGIFKKFKDKLNFLNITHDDITNLSDFEKLVDSKSDFICYNKEGKKNIKPKIKIKLKNIKDTLKHIFSINSSQFLPSLLQTSISASPLQTSSALLPQLLLRPSSPPPQILVK